MRDDDAKDDDDDDGFVYPGCVFAQPRDAVRVHGDESDDDDDDDDDDEEKSARWLLWS